jgi:GTPase
VLDGTADDGVVDVLVVVVEELAAVEELVAVVVVVVVGAAVVVLVLATSLDEDGEGRCRSSSTRPAHSSWNC